MDKQAAYSDEGTTYLDTQVEIGISKHMGGYAATDKLYELCHVSEAKTALEVGCGIGVGPVHLARSCNCHVTAVDISEKMLEWARLRAVREKLTDRISLQQADILDLPFEDNSFDAVIAESVLDFVSDKRKAINELIRVTQPGGYIGLNESFWTKIPPENAIKVTLGADILTLEQWQGLWSDLPLVNTRIVVQELTIKQEVKDRIHWVGWRYVLHAWVRVFKLFWRNPKAVQSIKSQLSTPIDVYKSMGYALFVGRKPEK